MENQKRRSRLIIVATIIVALVIAMIVTAIQTPRPEDRPENRNSESSEGGVTVHGFSAYGWIENGNSFPVRVKGVWIFQGETTQWITEFAPGERQPMFVSHQNGFHVYTLDGVEIGWIRPVQNGMPTR